MSFPTDIKKCMKDCILAILWPRKDILGFFKDVGCTSSDVACIVNFEGDQINRPQMVDAVFDALSDRDDAGLGQFRAMLKALVEWSHFDEYYFDKLAKLDRKTSNECLARLRRLQETRDGNLKRDKSRNAEKSKKASEATKTLAEVRDKFLSLFSSDNPHRRGYELEGVLKELSRLSGLQTTEAFRVNGEQIDAALKFDGEHYILEAKWHDAALSNEPLYQFAGKAEGKMYGRGIFVSINGYSDSVVHSLVTGKAVKTILVDGADITLVVEGMLTFADMIDKKVQAAQTQGLIYVDPTTGKAKIN